MKKRITDMGKGIVSGQSRCTSTRFSTSGSVSKPISTAPDTGRSRNSQGDACRFMLRTGMLLAVAMLILLALAGAGSAATVTNYSVSGYVKDASTGNPISGATVSTNTSNSTSTDGSGYYSFSLANGTYLITASKSGYADNSTTEVVNAGPVSNADILLSVYTGPSKILVATNRYVVLDDATTGGTASGTGFIVPSSNWGSNDFSGIKTTVNIYALVLDNDGLPMSNTNVTLTLKNPGGATDYTSIYSTDSKGLINVSRNLNAKNYYGKWQVDVNASDVTGSYKFIYNWWGCVGGASCEGHGNDKGDLVDSNSNIINSPYLGERKLKEESFLIDGEHNGAQCTYCHLSYNGQGYTPSMNTEGSHSSLRCDNANCHGTIVSHETNMVIGSCTNCHSSSNTTMKTTLNGVVANYSTTSTYHDADASIPCIICHGPMHNITKPDPSAGTLGPTEDSHCTTCHQGLTQHNTTVACTECHTQDVHVIKFIQNDNNFATTRTNAASCPDCHVGSGLASFATAPKITQITHSNNILNGTLWDRGTDFWTAADDESKCLYCHGETKHSAVAAGYINSFKGSNVIGGDLTGDWCAACHKQGSPNYNNMLSTLNLVPPEITGNATYGNYPAGAQDSTPYYDHTGISGFNDNDCAACHNSSASNITELMHTTLTGVGANPDCISCHDVSGSQNNVDFTNIAVGAHADLNSVATNTTASAKNKKCWGCHGDLNASGIANQSDQPSTSHPTNYNTPRTCPECHVNTVAATNLSAPQVTEHRKGGPTVATNTTECAVCHNNSLTSITEADGFGLTTGGNATNASTSHYLKNATLNLMTPTITSSNCTFCHFDNTANASWGTPVDPRVGFGSLHNGKVNTECYGCHGGLDASYKLHNSGITGGSAGGPDCVACHDAAGANNINMTLFTQSPHMNISNGNATNNKQCYTCHRDGTAPSEATGQAEHTSKTIRYNASNLSCADSACHGNASSPISVGSHFDNATQYSRLEASFIRTTQNCEFCHGKTQVPIFNQSIPGNGSNTSMVLDDGTGPTGHYVKNVADGDNHYVIDTVGWVENSINGSQGCVFCHKTQSAVFGASNISAWTNHSTYGDDCYGCHINGTTYLHDIGVITASGGTSDCIDCHGLGKPQADVNETAFGLSIHKDLNKDAVNVTALNNSLSKACWACHGNGSEPSGHVNDSLGVGVPANTTRPLNCSEGQCHVNGTPSGVFINGSQPNATIEHVPQAIINDSTDIYTSIAVDCTLCHKNSLMYNNDPVNGSANESDASNVSHYGSLTSTNISAVQPTTDCTLCHKNTTNAPLWANATQIRHPVNKSVGFCDNCHGIGDSLHDTN
ncbi:MAG: carboxypeptidase regulatory-like domain-containing protein, partial [ANME-2 cluster archaeon]|nr:carboxypeptidase regulatory-like domain-containing protein [ANME-2 cluster archaeon]